MSPVRTQTRAVAVTSQVERSKPRVLDSALLPFCGYLRGLVAQPFWKSSEIWLNYGSELKSALLINPAGGFRVGVGKRPIKEPVCLSRFAFAGLFGSQLIRKSTWEKAATGKFPINWISSPQVSKLGCSFGACNLPCVLKAARGTLQSNKNSLLLLSVNVWCDKLIRDVN